MGGFVWMASFTYFRAAASTLSLLRIGLDLEESTEEKTGENKKVHRVSTTKCEHQSTHRALTKYPQMTHRVTKSIQS